MHVCTVHELDTFTSNDSYNINGQINNFRGALHTASTSHIRKTACMCVCVWECAERHRCVEWCMASTAIVTEVTCKSIRCNITTVKVDHLLKYLFVNWNILCNLNDKYISRELCKFDLHLPISLSECWTLLSVRSRTMLSSDRAMRFWWYHFLLFFLVHFCKNFYFSCSVPVFISLEVHVSS